MSELIPPPYNGDAVCDEVPSRRISAALRAANRVALNDIGKAVQVDCVCTPVVCVDIRLHPPGCRLNTSSS